MSGRNIARMLLSVLMLAYIIFALIFTGNESANTPYTRVDIIVDDPDSTGFVTPSDIVKETDSLPLRYHVIPRSRINTLTLSQKLNAMVNIERASVVALNDGSLRISVTPMTPVARVFSPDGQQHYVNRQGKRLTASVDYNVDVPVVFGTFNASYTLDNLLPMLDYLTEHPDIDNFVTAITIDRHHDIIVTPPMRGHVINLGDARDLKNKWERLRAFYHEVMPRQGWEYYDTLSVKWRGQIVATRRQKALLPGTVLVAVTNDTIPVEDDIAPDDEGQNALFNQPASNT